ncbi:hypothetical protein LTR17_013912 [Elasticomyces elasticus]|nr:hypothetical protein LTR17_013912 [Elasticomyces elasticus]
MRDDVHSCTRSVAGSTPTLKGLMGLSSCRYQITLLGSPSHLQTSTANYAAEPSNGSPFRFARPAIAWMSTSGFGSKDRSENKREDVSAMVQKYPLWYDYWDDKKPQLHKVTAPIYATISYSTGLHTGGSFRGFYLSSSQEKWLQWTSTQEWHDIYQPDRINDLQRFFDKYMKGVDNGWEQTPRVRLSLLGYNRPSVVDRPIDAYPPQNFQYRSLYLDAASASLQDICVSLTSTGSYSASTKDHVGCTFSYTFDKYTELCGFSRVKLFMSAKGADDLDVCVVIRKLDAAGEALYHHNIVSEDLPPDATTETVPHKNVWKYVGPSGRLRASNRAVGDESFPGMAKEQYKALMSDAYLFHPFDNHRKLAEGEVVELDIGLWPGGIIFDAGESMRLEVMVRRPILPEFTFLEDENRNIGRHTVHTGGEHSSSLYVSLARWPLS